jgi:Flp pilus assembly protein TadG
MKATFARFLCHPRRSVAGLWRDRRGVASIEFAFIVPVMLLAFFGTVEFCSAVAVDRKVTLIARTLSDLTSQAAAPINDTYIQNVFTASIAIMNPYNLSPTTATISQIYVDSNAKATIQWSKAATFATGASSATLITSARNAGDNVTTLVPAALLIKQTYLILSEVGYKYVPTIGYVMAKSGINLGDVSYTRPRQLVCVIYNNRPVTPPATCPLT